MLWRGAPTLALMIACCVAGCAGGEANGLAVASTATTSGLPVEPATASLAGAEWARSANPARLANLSSTTVTAPAASLIAKPSEHGHTGAAPQRRPVVGQPASVSMAPRLEAIARLPEPARASAAQPAAVQSPVTHVAASSQISPTPPAPVTPPLPSAQAATAPDKSTLGYAPGTVKSDGQPAGTLKGFIVRQVSMFDDKGRWLRQLPATAMPSIPSGGIPFHNGPKSLVLVTIGGRELLLDRTELDLESGSRVHMTCDAQERKGLGTGVRTGGAAMGHGRCRS